MRKLQLNKITFLLLSTLFIFTIYFPLMTAKEIYDNDYEIVISPLFKVHSFSSYFDLLTKNIILDLQPMRDLSLLLAIKIQTLLQLKNILITYNVALWFICTYMVWRLFLKIRIKEALAFIGAIIFCIHPLFTQTVCWGSAHKHLLSFTFILFTLHLFFDIYVYKDKSKTKCFFLVTSFLFSILSQPISIGLPLWFLLYLALFGNRKTISTQEKISLIALFLIMGIGSILNFFYYSKTYLIAVGSAKFINAGLAESLLSIGRYFIQLIFPISFAQYYYQGSKLNIVGLLLLPLFFYLLVKFLKWKKTLLWGTLLLFPIVMVNIKPTNIFVSDTYLLIPSLGFFTLILLSLESIDFEKLDLQRKAITFVCLISVFCYFLYKSHAQSRLWVDSEKIITASYQEENACINLLSYSFLLWKMKAKRAEAIRLTKELIARNCVLEIAPSMKHFEARNAVAASVYFSEDLTYPQREAILIKLSKVTSYADIFLSALYLKTDRRLEAKNNLLKTIDPKNINTISLKNDPAFEEISSLCKDDKKSPCPEFNNYYNEIRGAKKLELSEPEL